MLDLWMDCLWKICMYKKDIWRINFYLNLDYLYVKICNEKGILEKNIYIYIVNETTLKHKSPKTFPIQLYNMAGVQLETNLHRTINEHVSSIGIKWVEPSR